MLPRRVVSNCFDCHACLAPSVVGHFLMQATVRIKQDNRIASAKKQHREKYGEQIESFHLGPLPVTTRVPGAFQPVPLANFAIFPVDSCEE